MAMKTLKLLQMGDDAPAPSTPSRKSTRQVVVAKRPKPTNCIEHQLLLEPTLARQAKKRRQRERGRRRKERLRRCNSKTDALILARNSADETDSEKSERSDDCSTEIQPSTRCTHGMKDIKRLRATNDNISCEKSGVVAVSKATRGPKRKMSAVSPDSVPSTRCWNDQAKPHQATRATPASSQLMEHKKRQRTAERRSYQSQSIIQHLRRRQQSLPEARTSSSSSIRTSSPHVLNGRIKKGATAAAIAAAEASSAAASRREIFELASHREILEISARIQQIVQHQRCQFAIDSLLLAKDVASIYAALAVLRDLKDQNMEWAPTVLQLITEAQVTSQSSLSQTLLEKLTLPISFGGLEYTVIEAQILTNRLMEHMPAILMGKMTVSCEELILVGLPCAVVMEIFPVLNALSTEVQRKFFDLSNQILSIGAESSLDSRALEHDPTLSLLSISML